MPDIEGPYTVTAPALNLAAIRKAADAGIEIQPRVALALVAEIERLTAERDEARTIAAKWFGSGSASSSRWCDRTIDLWYAHRKVIESWTAAQEARP